MKSKSKNTKLRELFRRKLENAEVVPGAGVKSKLMQRVARKEFMRFNPGRFNMYYLGTILITGITAAVLLFSASEDSYTLVPPNNPDKLNNADITGYIEVQVEQPLITKPEKVAVKQNESIRNNDVSVLSENALIEKTVIETVRQTEFPEKIDHLPTEIFNSILKSGIFTKARADKMALKSGFRAEVLIIDPLTSVGCAPLKLRFYNRSTSYDSCRWSFGDGGFSKEENPEWIFNVAGEYKVALQVFTPKGKILTSSATVKVHPRPQAHFEIVPEKEVLPVDEIRFLNYSTNAVQYLWDFGDGFTSEFFEPRHTYANFSDYNVRLVVFSDWGCSDSLTVLNVFSGSEYFIDFPNAFIPNAQGPSGGVYSSTSDEVAQVFHPFYSGVTDYQLKIFSKLGIPIFESNDINLGWDGYNKGQLCEPGVYIWKVRGKFRNGELFIKMGDITLLKN